jgi:hypothetical protein
MAVYAEHVQQNKRHIKACAGLMSNISTLTMSNISTLTTYMQLLAGLLHAYIPVVGHQRLGSGFDHLWEASHVWLLRW